jgi:uncharacterized protein (DUF1684 family)
MKVNFKILFTPANIVKVGILITLLIFIYNLYKNTYEQQIETLRKEKDHYFRTSINSPVEGKSNFEGLNYFPPNKKFKVMATLGKINNQEEQALMGSDGRKIVYKKFAIAAFEIDNKKYKLQVYTQIKGEKTHKVLFIPFTDNTNGETTYQSGRYLDAEYTGIDKQLLLDFNRAYHPYCVYSYKYSCPLPPSENYLDLSVTAGEKLPINDI